MCDEWKPETDFAFRSIKTGRRQSHCRKCHAAYRREHYARTKQTYIENERVRIRDRRHRNRALLLEYLLAHPCVDCGQRDPVVLDFDHRDPRMKRAEIAKLAARQTWETVLSEIAKCDVRCASCHRKRTAAQFNWRRVTLTSEAIAFGTKDPAVLELDHKDRPSKVAAVSTLVRSQSWRALFAEIDKCEVRCANCHRRRTAKQFRYFRLEAQVAKAS
jgi:hypothetical protein